MVDYNNIESQFKSHCDALEVTPPLDGWSRLEATLNNRKRKKRVLWLQVSTIAASLLILLSVGTLMWLLPEEKQMPLTIQTTPSQQSPAANSGQRLSESMPNASTKRFMPDTLTQSSQLRNLALVDAGRSEIRIKPEDRPQSEVIPYRSNLHSLHNYFTTDKVEVKTLIKSYPKTNLADLYKVKTLSEAETKPTTPFVRRIEFGGVYSPVYAFRQTSGPTGVPSTMLAAVPPEEQGVVYAGGGLRLNVMVHKKWSIESGVRFARLGQEVNSQIQVNELYAVSSTGSKTRGAIKTVSLNNSMGHIKQNNPPAPSEINLLNSSNKNQYHVEFSSDADVSAQSLEQNLDYLEVPLTLRYYLVNKGMTLSLSAGVSTNWLISNNVFLDGNDTRKNIGETSGVASMTFSSHAGLAITLPVVKQLSLQLEPRLNYFLNEINKDYPVTFRPYSFGVYSGLQYSFGK